ncbi:non-specific lipid-transfer protein [Cinnamomum micranthum f. kanehirae]|uniref:Non-specific lipid-transfer protein n=1 Tax=Cinnamomum micranthum f. kanehirae TaxID=337451 RepID=A0A3S3P7Z7_9MAGN|nr:non-specific lipid-transfer protein [Cinnamomum micranthum f. kanehirae]
MAYSRVACLVLAFVMLATLLVDAANLCAQLQKQLNPCMDYLKDKSGDSRGCCSNVKILNAKYKTIAERQTACKCIVQEVHGAVGLDLNRLANLPTRCGVSIHGYRVRQNFDCKKIK